MKKLLNLENLTQQAAYQLFAEFSTYPRAHQVAILALLRGKKETTAEILGALQYFSQYSVNIRHDFDVVDIVGTGGDGAGTFNISTAASIVMASCGALVAKHGGRSATSQTGSNDLIQALGVQIPQAAEESLKQLQATNYTYLSAPLFNQELKKYGPLRQQLGFPTIFNLLGPLLNPMLPKKCVIGVYRRDLMLKVAEILILRGINHALVVHSDDGLDELSISSNTNLIEVKQGKIQEYALNPEDFGLPKAGLTEVQGGDASANAKLIREILAGKITGPKLNIVLLNAGAGLYVSGKVHCIAEGLQLAAQAIQQNKAISQLDKIRGGK